MARREALACGQDDRDRASARIEYHDEGEEDTKYDFDSREGYWSLRHLIHHLLWHCAQVNKLVRRLLSRGPITVYATAEA